MTNFQIKNMATAKITRATTTTTIIDISAAPCFAFVERVMHVPKSSPGS
eukprot:XP_001709986.1 Hypothetical protein GL50803_27616 [Giardia lamblia ATCC 50803]